MPLGLFPVPWANDLSFRVCPTIGGRRRPSHLPDLLMSKDTGPFGPPDADGCLFSFSQVSGTMCRSSGVC
eukprot:2065915-Heterocapsa_arctica.AAC.1